jgi:hypothetical protein
MRRLPIGLLRVQSSDAEFLGLHESPAREGLPRDAGGKTKVVLDTRAGAGLAAEGAAIEHDHVQAFRRCVHRGCQAGGAGTDHGHVEQLIALGGVHHAKATRQCIFGRVNQDRAVGAYGQQLAGAVLFEQRRGVGIFRRIDQVIGVAVATQKVFEPRHVGRLWLADEHRSARARFNERHAPQNQRAGNAFAKIRFGHEQRAQLRRRHHQRFDFFVCMAVDKGRAAAQLAHLGEKLARPLANDGHYMPEAVTLRDGHHALEQHEHARACFSGGKEPFPARESLHRPEPRNARDLGIAENGKGLVKAVVEIAACVCGHLKKLQCRDPPH